MAMLGLNRHYVGGAEGYGFHFTYASPSKALNCPAGAVSLIPINCGQIHET